MSDLYKTIKHLCTERGITGYRLCKDIGIYPSVLTDLGKGRKKALSGEYLDKIARYFGVSVSYLLGTEDAESPFSLEDGLSDKDAMLLAWFRSLPVAKQQAVLLSLDAPEGLI